MSDRATFAVLFVAGAAIALAGDAAHVQAGITEYLWDGVPTIWKSALWFPILVGGAVAAGGWIGSRFDLPRSDRRRTDVVIGMASVLGLYFVTTLVADAPQIAANGICWAVAIVIWLWWDPSRPAFFAALAAMILGPIAEIMMIELGASRYLPGHDQLLGAAPWLLPLYFAAGAVLSGSFRALQRA